MPLYNETADLSMRICLCGTSFCNPTVRCRFRFKHVTTTEYVDCLLFSSHLSQGETKTACY